MRKNSFYILIFLGIVTSLILNFSWKRKIKVVINKEDIFLIDSKLNLEFYKKYNEWSMDSEIKSNFFGYEKDGIKCTIKVRNNKISQLFFSKELNDSEVDYSISINSFEVSTKKLNREGIVTLIIEDVFFSKRIIDDILFINVVDLRNVDYPYFIEPLMAAPNI